MDITRVTKANHSFFQNFIPDSVNNAYKQGTAFIMLGLVEGTKAVGAITATFADADMQILSIYVSPDYRRQGGGSLLLNTLVEATNEYVMDYSVDFLLNTQDSEELEAFLLAMGFDYRTEKISDMYAISLSDIIKTKAFKENDSFGVTFASLDENEYSRLKKYAVAEAAFIPEKGLDATEVDRDVSILYKKESTINGFIVFEKISENTLMISGIQNNGDKMAPANMMQRAFTECLNKYGDKLTLLVEPVNDVVRGFVEMVPEAKNVARSMVRSGLMF